MPTAAARSILVLGALLSLLTPSQGRAQHNYEDYAGQKRVRMEPDVTHFTGRNWLQGRRVSDADRVQVHFMLRHDADALARLEQALYEVSDPRHDRYGRHLSIDDVAGLLDIDPHHATAVKDMLLAYGVPEDDIRINRYRDVVWASLPGLLAEDMLDAKLYHYHHKVVGELDIIRCSSGYSLPSSVAPYVSLVADLIRFPHHRHHRVHQPQINDSTVGDSTPFQSCGRQCSGFTTPDVLANRYGFSSLGGAAEVSSGSGMAVAEFQLQFWDNKDLQTFAQTCGTDNAVAVDRTVGVNLQRACRVFECIESLLDIEYLSAVASPIPLSVYYSTSYSLLDWITAVNDEDQPPLVHSVSYGNDEAQQTSVEYMTSVNTEFMKAGSRGVSVLFASGDQGVWGREGTGTGTFNPDFPAASPYVTAVGGTDFQEQSTIGEEVVWSGSGGGFSDTFALPPYQSEAVAGYKMVASSSLPPSKLWNDSGRGYPDVSALAGLVNPYCIAYGGSGSLGGVAGTSAASPTVAGIFAQLNNVRLANNQPPLGFLNPWIYQNQDGFHDVTQGMNDDGEGVGFQATEGWDPASGVGTPNFEALVKLI